MRRFRRLALFLLLFYTAFVIGASLHSHSGQSAANGDCRLCQVTRTFLIETLVSSCAPQMEDLGVFYQELEVAFVPDSSSSSFGRAPPV